jgi:phosphoribosyl-ATP pyrophosphohydrolase
MSESVDDMAVLDRVYNVILTRRDANPDVSHVGWLFHKGTQKIAQKMGEEAIETVVATMSQKRKDIVGESADLMFHLLVLWADSGIRPKDVWAELARRESVHAIDEKRKRNGP